MIGYAMTIFKETIFLHSEKYGYVKNIVLKEYI